MEAEERKEVMIGIKATLYFILALILFSGFLYHVVTDKSLDAKNEQIKIIKQDD